MVDVAVTVLVVVLLFAVKLGGYGLAIRFAAPRLYPDRPPRTWLVATIRTIAGALATALLAGLGTLVVVVLQNDDTFGTVVGAGTAYLGQLAFRALIWGLIVVGFYDPKLANPRRALGVVAGAVALGYLLDIPEYLLAIGNLAFLMRDVRFC
jgi:hypothetical protein